MEWITLWGCSTTSTRSVPVPNSQQASITSRPLFIMVAESTEILRPITQLGWAQACSGVTPARASGLKVRNGPPEAVSRMRSTPTRSSPRAKSAGMHWKMALCSLSMGSSSAPLAWISSMNSCPDMTRASLLASMTRLPARAAARVGIRPAAPTMPAIT